jgi:hypothetical protein
LQCYHVGKAAKIEEDIGMFVSRCILTIGAARFAISRDDSSGLSSGARLGNPHPANAPRLANAYVPPPV